MVQQLSTLLRRPAISTTYSHTHAPKLTQCDLIRQFQDTIQYTRTSRPVATVRVPILLLFMEEFERVKKPALVICFFYQVVISTRRFRYIVSAPQENFREPSTACALCRARSGKGLR